MGLDISGLQNAQEHYITLYRPQLADEKLTVITGLNKYGLFGRNAGEIIFSPKRRWECDKFVKLHLNGTTRPLEQCHLERRDESREVYS